MPEQNWASHRVERNLLCSARVYASVGLGDRLWKDDDVRRTVMSRFRQDGVGLVDDGPTRTQFPATGSEQKAVNVDSFCKVGPSDLDCCQSELFEGRGHVRHQTAAARCRKVAESPQCRSRRRRSVSEAEVQAKGSEAVSGSSTA